MTRKIYKSAMGKTVDMGSLLLQNENTRAVGNMNVNARGDLLDSTNRVIDQKNRQVQRQYKAQTNVLAQPAATSTLAVRRARLQPDVVGEEIAVEQAAGIATPVVDELSSDAPVVLAPEPVATTNVAIPQGGLAAAIAKTQNIKQELEKTARQKLQSAPVRKI
jgi:hypothetical protein